eukprot:Mrub_09156.p1 GENE.Mrub_09156~~Mrub_09156.p1  ORF type:complete len:249 (+),score=77.71 Mrub_09156:2-748(+)
MRSRMNSTFSLMIWAGPPPPPPSSASSSAPESSGRMSSRKLNISLEKMMREAVSVLGCMPIETGDSSLMLLSMCCSYAAYVTSCETLKENNLPLVYGTNSNSSQIWSIVDYDFFIRDSFKRLYVDKELHGLCRVVLRSHFEAQGVLVVFPQPHACMRRTNPTNQFIEQVEKMEDNFKLYKVFQWIVQTKKDDYYREILSNLQVTEFNAPIKLSELTNKIIKHDYSSIGDMLDKIKNEMSNEIKGDSNQ